MVNEKTGEQATFHPYRLLIRDDFKDAAAAGNYRVWTARERKIYDISKQLYEYGEPFWTKEGLRAVEEQLERGDEVVRLPTLTGNDVEVRVEGAGNRFDNRPPENEDPL
ncbi:Uu.00g049300.m01.CDS01 [Anthostomella pinea]|uniref:Uu.00g049300.m01.CDS01 n=1 Tax=Anthostomella pinea TaxID=933095 RepID=A0AAI8VCL6_9PEZI|nr:Uu.00g049300.m01.CDS01 [Anthostomella pinea]